MPLATATKRYRSVQKNGSSRENIAMEKAFGHVVPGVQYRVNLTSCPCPFCGLQ